MNLSFVLYCLPGVVLPPLLLLLGTHDPTFFNALRSRKLLISSLCIFQTLLHDLYCVVESSGSIIIYLIFWPFYSIEFVESRKQAKRRQLLSFFLTLASLTGLYNPYRPPSITLFTIVEQSVFHFSLLRRTFCMSSTISIAPLALWRPSSTWILNCSCLCASSNSNIEQFHFAFI